MALLAPLTATVAGTPVAYAVAAAGGDTVAVGARSRLLVRNGSAASVTVTIAAAGALVDEVAYGPIVVAVPAGADRLIAIPPRLADPATGLATVTYSAAASVTIAHLSGA